MKRDRIQLAQFGVGRWGNHLLRNFLALPEVDIVTVVEPSCDRHASIRRKFELSDSVILTNLKETVLDNPDIDAVVVATPAITHYPLVKSALLAGKHVLVEKPLTLTVDECEGLCALAIQQNRQLVVDHTYLLHPVVKAGRALFAQRLLGNLHYGYATRTNLGPVRHDVDAMWDLAIHDIAIFNHWLQEMPIAVSAHGHSWLPRNHTSSQTVISTDLADIVWLRLEYPSGFQATIHVSWANVDKQRRLGVVGDRGTLIFDEMQPQTPLVLQRGSLERDGNAFIPTGLSYEAIALPSEEPLANVCRHFVQCIVTQTPSEISSGSTGTDLVRILSALSQSLNSDGRTLPVSHNR